MDTSRLSSSNQELYRLGHGSATWPLVGNVAFDATPFRLKKRIPIDGWRYLEKGHAVVLSGPLRSQRAAYPGSKESVAISCTDVGFRSSNDSSLVSPTIGQSATLSRAAAVFDKPNGTRLKRLPKGTSLRALTRPPHWKKGAGHPIGGLSVPPLTRQKRGKRSWVQVRSNGVGAGYSFGGWMDSRDLSQPLLLGMLTGSSCQARNRQTSKTMSVFAEPLHGSESVVVAKDVSLYAHKKVVQGFVALSVAGVRNLRSHKEGNGVFWVKQEVLRASTVMAKDRHCKMQTLEDSWPNSAETFKGPRRQNN